MQPRIPKSLAMYQRALELIPGGTQLVSRRPTRYANGVSPIYAARAKGSRIWDVDGFEYIDWVSGIGAILLGYGDPVVDEAVTRQISQGTTSSINHPLEVELAEELCHMIPSAEMVRYCKGGGDACAMAVRIARGFTGRDKILFCGYHGWHDWYLAANLENDQGLSAHLFPGIDPIGVPRALAGTAIPFPFGDTAALEELFARHAGEVAAVMMEPLRSQDPPAGYLEAVKQIAHRHGAILIFDEVSCGFRFGLEAAQGYVGVTPDMAVFAKSISNGFPMGVVVGRRAVLESAAQMFISSTYWNDAIGLVATLTTLREIRARNIPEKLWAYGRQLQTAIGEAARQTGLAAQCAGLPIHPQVQFETDDAALKSRLSTLYIQEMAKRGCHGYASFYLNAAQNGDDLEQTTHAARETFEIIERGWRTGTLDSLLECDLTKDAFRRLVR